MPPSPHRFVKDIQPTLSEQIFNVAITERETQIKPDGETGGAQKI
jgi:hypothetical protein